jgi:hypothetical protein
VLNFLKSKGYPLNGASIRTALEQNAREPGYIPGLDNNAPSTEAEDQAAMRAAGVGSGGRGGSSSARPSVANKIEAGSPKDASNTTMTPSEKEYAGRSSAQPTGTNPSDSSMLLPAAILGGSGLAGAGLWRASKFAGGSTPLAATPAVGESVPPYTAEGFDPLQRPPVQPYNAEGVDPLQRAPVDPMQAALDRAMQPSATGPSSLVAPTTNTATNEVSIGNARPMDPGAISDANIAGGFKPAPDVPFTPRPGIPTITVRPGGAVRTAPNIGELVQGAGRVLQGFRR